MSTITDYKPEQIAIYESKNSEKVAKFIPLTVKSLSEYCSRSYARKIIREHENSCIWGIHFTKGGSIRAIFI